MNLKYTLTIITILLIGIGCGSAEETNNDDSIEKAVPLGDNSFVYDGKVYKIINNELIQIGDLTDTTIRKLKISISELKDLGASSLDFIKPNAEVKVSSLYRGNFLYYKVILTGINDLKEKFRPGKFIIDFRDENGFSIASVDINTSDLIGGVIDGNVAQYSYHGKIEMNLESQAAISSYDISSTVTKK